MQLSIIVPTYNERERLGELVRAITEIFRAHGISGEVVIVDDNSPDGTGQVADQLARQHPMTVVHRPDKLGLGSAVLDGFTAARGAVLGVMDADLSHPPALIPRMLAEVVGGGADFAIGSRYVPGGATQGWPTRRLMMSRLACLLARPLTPVRDATSGFFLLRREVVRETHISAAGFKICLELLVRGRARSVIEMPYLFTNRMAGRSKMNVREVIGYLGQLRNLLWHRLRHSTAPRPAYRRLSIEHQS